MIFQRTGNSYFDLAEPIETARLTIRFPVLADYVQWAELRHQSRKFLVPFESSWPANDLSRTAFAHRIKRYRSHARKDEAYPFFIFLADDDQTLVGGLTVSNVRRGISQSASLGYWIGQPFANNGYMTEAVKAIGNFCFDQLGLHRLEAACLLHNGPSVSVLEKAGFTREGQARKYLKINGRWQDHLLFALLSDDRAVNN